MIKKLLFFFQNTFLSKWLRDVSIAKKLYFVLGIMALLITLELLTLFFAINILSSVRAYVGAEGLYSKAQKDAVYHLRKYGSTGDEKDYQEYLRFIQVNLGDEQARSALLKKNPDLGTARQGFLKARNHSDDIDGMIKLFRKFQWISYIDKSISIWTQGDFHIAELQLAAHKLHTYILSGNTTQEGIKNRFEEIDALNAKLTKLEDDFSYTLGEGSRWLENLILKTLLFITLTVELTGIILTVSVNLRISRGISESLRIVKKVSQGDYTERIQIRSKDELGQLASSLNKMTNDLEENINERKRIEEVLSRSEKQLMGAQKIAHIGSWEWDIIADKITWSEELYRIFGLTPTDFNATFEDYLQSTHPYDRDYVNGIVQQAFKDHKSFNFFHKIILPNRKVRVVKSTGKVYLDKNGHVIMMAGTAQDVTEIKRTENKLKKSSERFLKIFDNNPVAMTLTEIKSNKIVYANNLFHTTLGYSKEEVIGHTSDELNLISPSEKKRMNSLIDSYLKNKIKGSFSDFQSLSVKEKVQLLSQLKQVDAMKSFEVQYSRKNGKTFPALVSFEVIGILNKKYAVTSYQDISERKKTEEIIKTESAYVKVLQKVASASNDSKTFEEAAQIALDKICELTGWPVGHVYLLDLNKPDKLKTTGIWHMDNPHLFQGFKEITDVTDLEIGIGLPGRVWKKKTPAWIPDVSVDTNFPRNKATTDIKIKAGFAFPIMVGNNVGGVIEFYSLEVIEKPNKQLLEVVANIGILLGRVIERHQAEEKLRKEQASLTGAQKIAQIGSWEWDITEDKITWSDELYRLFGLTPKEFEATFEDYLKYTHPDDQDDVDAIIRQAFKDHKPFNFFHRIILPNRKVRVIKSTGTVYLDGNGNAITMAGTAQDVTKIKRIEKELIQAKETAQVSVKVKEQFLANMSHEIRTPMNAVIGFTRLLEDTRLSHKQKDWLKAIKSSGENLLVIINDILDFSKIEAGKIEFEENRINIVSLLHSIVTMVKPEAKENIELLFFTDIKENSIILGDSVRLTQILLNLLSNALKFTEQGKVEVNATTLEEDNKYIRLQFSVTDTGIGIPKDKLSYIFESFTQESSSISRKYGGTGLGLTITKKLVELQGGTLTVKSKYKEGSCFTVTLPFKKSTLKDSPKTKKETKVLNLESVGNLKVLIVEDSLLNQKVVKTVLEKWKIKVDIADNGKLAIQKLESNNYNLILMDVQMPEMDGYETTQYIRNHLHNTIPIIAMTAHVFKGEAEKCIQFGMNDYISKPFDSEELLSKIIYHTKEKQTS